MARTPIHPGEHLAEELREMGLSAAELARQIDIPASRLRGILNGRHAVTAEIALRLGHWFGTSPDNPPKYEPTTYGAFTQHLLTLNFAHRQAGEGYSG